MPTSLSPSTPKSNSPTTTTSNTMAIIFTDTPDNNCSVFEPLLYTISNPDNLSVDAEVFSTNETSALGIKRIPASTYASFNIAGYLRRRLNPTPFTTDSFGLFSDPLRTITVAVRCGSAISPVRTFSAATSKLYDNQYLSDMPCNRSIAWHENDEISLYIPDSSLYYKLTLSGPSKIIFSSPRHTFSRGIVSLCIDMKTLYSRLINYNTTPEDYHSMCIEIYNGNQQLISLHYTLNTNPSASSNTRLCWLNRLGAIDFFSFSKPSDTSLSVSKEHCLCHDTLAVSNLSASTQFKVSSGFLPQNTLNPVAAIISSPRVWMVNQNTLIPIDITSDSLHFSHSALNSVEISFRPCTPQVCQNF